MAGSATTDKEVNSTTSDTGDTKKVLDQDGVLQRKARGETSYKNYKNSPYSDC